MVPVNILVEEGSDSTLFCVDLIRRLQLTGKRQTLVVEGVGEESTTHLNSEYIKMQLRTASGEIVTVQRSAMPSISNQCQWSIDRTETTLGALFRSSADSPGSTF